jgi:hypothetical protein
MSAAIFHEFHGWISVDEANVWTPEIVAQRLIEYFEVEMALPAGGAGGGSFWNRVRYDGDDLKGWDMEAEFKEAQKRQARARPMASPGAIARANEACGWALRYLNSDAKGRAMARAVLAWALCKASHKSFSAVIRARGWKPTTVDRYRRQGLQLISEGLARDRVKVREAYAGDMAAGAEFVLR